MLRHPAAAVEGDPLVRLLSVTVCGAAMDREVGLKAEEAFVGGGETVQHGALVRRRSGVRETHCGRRRAVHVDRGSRLARDHLQGLCRGTAHHVSPEDLTEREREPASLQNVERRQVTNQSANPTIYLLGVTGVFPRTCTNERTYGLPTRSIFTGAAALRGVRALLQARCVAAEAVDLCGERVG